MNDYYAIRVVSTTDPEWTQGWWGRYDDDLEVVCEPDPIIFPKVRAESFLAYLQYTYPSTVFELVLFSAQA